MSFEALEWLQEQNYSMETHEVRMAMIAEAKRLFPEEESDIVGNYI